MNDVSAEFAMLQLRMAGIGTQLDGDWATKLDAQRHLDRDTAECAYWHAGYHQALADVLNMVAKPCSNADISDRSSPLLAVG